jgi:hypothetical protein
MPETLDFVFTLSYMGVTTVKRFSLPSAWLDLPEARVICAAYADSALQDMVRPEK